MLTLANRLPCHFDELYDYVQRVQVHFCEQSLQRIRSKHNQIMLSELNAIQKSCSSTDYSSGSNHNNNNQQHADDYAKTVSTSLLLLKQNRILFKRIKQQQPFSSHNSNNLIVLDDDHTRYDRITTKRRQLEINDDDDSNDDAASSQQQFKSPRKRIKSNNIQSVYQEISEATLTSFMIKTFFEIIHSPQHVRSVSEQIRKENFLLNNPSDDDNNHYLPRRCSHMLGDNTLIAIDDADSEERNKFLRLFLKNNPFLSDHFHIISSTSSNRCCVVVDERKDGRKKEEDGSATCAAHHQHQHHPMNSHHHQNRLPWNVFELIPESKSKLFFSFNIQMTSDMLIFMYENYMTRNRKHRSHQRERLKNWTDIVNQLKIINDDDKEAHIIYPDDLRAYIVSLIMADPNSLIFYGSHNLNNYQQQQSKKSKKCLQKVKQLKEIAKWNLQQSHEKISSTSTKHVEWEDLAVKTLFEETIGNTLQAIRMLLFHSSLSSQPTSHQHHDHSAFLLIKNIAAVNNQQHMDPSVWRNETSPLINLKYRIVFDRIIVPTNSLVHLHYILVNRYLHYPQRESSSSSTHYGRFDWSKMVCWEDLFPGAKLEIPYSHPYAKCRNVADSHFMACMDEHINPNHLLNQYAIVKTKCYIPDLFMPKILTHIPSSVNHNQLSTFQIFPAYGSSTTNFSFDVKYCSSKKGNVVASGTTTTSSMDHVCRICNNTLFVPTTTISNQYGIDDVRNNKHTISSSSYLKVCAYIQFWPTSDFEDENANSICIIPVKNLLEPATDCHHHRKNNKQCSKQYNNFVNILSGCSVRLMENDESNTTTNNDLEATSTTMFYIQPDQLRQYEDQFPYYYAPIVTHHADCMNEKTHLASPDDDNLIIYNQVDVKVNVCGCITRNECSSPTFFSNGHQQSCYESEKGFCLNSPSLTLSKLLQNNHTHLNSFVLQNESNIKFFKLIQSMVYLHNHNSSTTTTSPSMIDDVEQQPTVSLRKTTTTMSGCNNSSNINHNNNNPNISSSSSSFQLFDKNFKLMHFETKTSAMHITITKTHTLFPSVSLLLYNLIFQQQQQCDKDNNNTMSTTVNCLLKLFGIATERPKKSNNEKKGVHINYQRDFHLNHANVCAKTRVQEETDMVMYEGCCFNDDYFTQFPFTPSDMDNIVLVFSFSSAKQKQHQQQQQSTTSATTTTLSGNNRNDKKKEDTLLFDFLNNCVQNEQEKKKETQKNDNNDDDDGFHALTIHDDLTFLHTILTNHLNIEMHSCYFDVSRNYCPCPHNYYQRCCVNKMMKESEQQQQHDQNNNNNIHNGFHHKLVFEMMLSRNSLGCKHGDFTGLTPVEMHGADNLLVLVHCEDDSKALTPWFFETKSFSLSDVGKQYFQMICKETMTPECLVYMLTKDFVLNGIDPEDNLCSFFVNDGNKKQQDEAKSLSTTYLPRGNSDYYQLLNKYKNLKSGKRSSVLQTLRPQPTSSKEDCSSSRNTTSTRVVVVPNEQEQQHERQTTTVINTTKHQHCFPAIFHISHERKSLCKNLCDWIVYEYISFWYASQQTKKVITKTIEKEISKVHKTEITSESTNTITTTTTM